MHEKPHQWEHQCANMASLQGKDDAALLTIYVLDQPPSRHLRYKSVPFAPNKIVLGEQGLHTFISERQTEHLLQTMRASDFCDWSLGQSAEGSVRRCC